MPKLSDMSPEELARLIVAASAELARRAGVRAILPTASVAPAAPQKAPRPSNEDADFVLYIKSRLESGLYVTANDRRRVADIAVNHRDWVKRQGLPVEHNTGPWRKATEFLSRKRPQER